MTSAARGRLGRWAFYGLATLILIFLVLPTLIIIPMSFSPGNYLQFPPQGFSTRWYAEYFTDSSWIDATLFSLQIAAMTTVVSVVIGTMGSIALVRGDVPMPDTLTAVLLAPLIVPHVVVAIAVYFQFAPLGLVGTRLGFVLIHTALAVPYVVLVVTAALQRVPPSYEMAALNLGASRMRAFSAVTLPLIGPAIGAGGIFAFLASFDETVVAFFISGVEHKTITRKMMEDIEFNLSPVIAAASTIFVIATVLVMMVGMRARRKANA